MALRAGYYGLKRFEKNKLSILAASMPTDISPDNPIAGKNDVLTSIDLLDDTTGWLSYNLLNNILSSGSSHEVAYTVNADKSVSASGQADADVYLKVMNEKTFPAGSYHFEGCPSGGSTGKYSFFIRPTNTALSVYGEDIGSGIDFTISEPTELVAFIKIKNGYPTNGATLLFKPMLCKLIYKGMPYRPYHASVADAIENSKPKVATFSRTSSATGNILLSETPRYIIAINCAYCVDPYIYSGQQYGHVTDATSSYTIPAEGTTITGTYLYYDIPEPANRELLVATEVKEPEIKETVTKKATKKKVVKEEEE